MAKTLKLKSPEPTISAAPAEGGSDGIFVSSRHRNPMEDAGAGQRENWTWAAIVAILSTVIVLATLAVEYMDWSALRFA